jgi:proliferating cell nuclear antigen
MRVVLTDKEHIAKFVMVFKGVMGMNNIVSIQCMSDKFYSQSMDQALSSIVEVDIAKDWFDEYICEDSSIINLNVNTLVKVLECWSPGYKLTIYDDDDKIIINFDGDGLVSKKFELIQISVNNDIFNIPEKDYDIDMVLTSDAFKDIIDELKLFHDTLEITCDMDNIIMKTVGEEGSASIKIKDGDVLEYAVALNDGDIFEQKINISKISNCCNINKLNDEVHVHLSTEQPFKIYYSLDEPNHEGTKSFIRFFIAPKVY